MFNVQVLPAGGWGHITTTSSRQCCCPSAICLCDPAPAAAAHLFCDTCTPAPAHSSAGHPAGRGTSGQTGPPLQAGSRNGGIPVGEGVPGQGAGPDGHTAAPALGNACLLRVNPTTTGYRMHPCPAPPLARNIPRVHTCPLTKGGEAADQHKAQRLLWPAQLLDCTEHPGQARQMQAKCV